MAAGNGADPEATRATAASFPAEEEATRRTMAAAVLDGMAEAAVAPLPGAGAVPSGDATRRTRAPAGPASPGGVGRRLRRVPWKALGALALLLLLAREISAFGGASDLRAHLASRPRGEALAVWKEYRRDVQGHLLSHLTGIDGAVRDWLTSHADDLISRYRSDTPTLYENGWRTAEALLQRAATIDPGNRRIQARLEFCRAHLLRIAARDAKQLDDSSSSYDEAVSRFERAARLWPGWGDPQVGLAQIYAYGKRDPERTAAALERAREDGYPFGERETALLGDAYRLRAQRRWASSTEAFDKDQLYRHLERVRDDCAHALEQYEQVPSYGGVSRNLRDTRQLLAEVDARMGSLTSEPVLSGLRGLLGLP